MMKWGIAAWFKCAIVKEKLWTQFNQRFIDYLLSFRSIFHIVLFSNRSDDCIDTKKILYKLKILNQVILLCN